jgi:hypothetical protein
LYFLSDVIDPLARAGFPIILKSRVYGDTCFWKIIIQENAEDFLFKKVL